MPNKKHINKTCPQCSIEFITAYQTQIFCNRQCFKTYNSIKVKLTRDIDIRPDGCWWWTGFVDPLGYGISHDGKGKNVKVHRAAYELHKGPIPENKIIDHACHKWRECVSGVACMHRRCVNPDHLQLSTKLENGSAERASHVKASAFWRGKTVCPRGHQYTPENTFIGTKGERLCIACRRNRADAVTEARRARGLIDPADINRNKTHCPQGHEYNTENTIHTKKGHRACRICSRFSARKSYRKMLSLRQ